MNHLWLSWYRSVELAEGLGFKAKDLKKLRETLHLSMGELATEERQSSLKKKTQK